jgi:hypothetical protein
LRAVPFERRDNLFDTGAWMAHLPAVEPGGVRGIVSFPGELVNGKQARNRSVARRETRENNPAAEK